MYEAIPLGEKLTEIVSHYQRVADQCLRSIKASSKHGPVRSRKAKKLDMGADVRLMPAYNCI